MVTAGSAYVTVMVDTVTSPAESVAFTSIVCWPSVSAPVAND